MASSPASTAKLLQLTDETHLDGPSKTQLATPQVVSLKTREKPTNTTSSGMILDAIDRIDRQDEEETCFMNTGVKERSQRAIDYHLKVYTRFKSRSSLDSLQAGMRSRVNQNQLASLPCLKKGPHSPTRRDHIPACPLSSSSTSHADHLQVCFTLGPSLMLRHHAILLGLLIVSMIPIASSLKKKKKRSRSN